MVLVIGFLSATPALAKYHQRFPKQRHPNKNVFIGAFSKLCETGYFPSAKVTSGRGSGQTLEEVENISQLAEKGAISSSQKVTVKSTKKSSSNTP